MLVTQTYFNLYLNVELEFSTYTIMTSHNMFIDVRRPITFGLLPPPHTHTIE